MSTIAIVGGTGPQGKGLGFRFARAGYDVILGSRSENRAAAAAAALEERLLPSGRVRGASNAKAAEVSDMVFLAVPYSGHDALVAELSPSLTGATVVSCVNPLGFDERGPFGLDLGPTSAAEIAQQLLPESHIVGAFHHLSALTLISDAAVLDREDVLVCGDNQEAKERVMGLAAAITGKPGIDAGPLRLARQLEPLTAVLISVNRKYKVRSGLALAGLDPNA